MGFNILPDSFGGFVLFNHTGKAFAGTPKTFSCWAYWKCSSGITKRNVWFVGYERELERDELVNDPVPAPNFLKQETKKLTEQYIKHKEDNCNGEIIYLLFFDKLVQNVQKYIN